jgi:tetratricopeptide (TPR) repeat protein
MDLGYFKEARQDIDKSIKLDSTLSYGHFLKGFIMMKLDSLDAALSDFKKAIVYNDTNVFNFLYSAEVYSRKGKFREADSLYNRALKINKKFGDAHFGLGNLNMIKGDLINAEKEYKKAIALNPVNSFAYLNLAIIYIYKAPGKALTFIDKSIKASPSFAKAYFLRGCLNLSKGEITNTLSDWKIAIDLDSSNNEYRLTRSFLYINKQRYQEGMEDLLHVMKSYGSKNYIGDFQESPKIQMANDFISQVMTYRYYSGRLSSSEKEGTMSALCSFVLEKNKEAESRYENLLNNSSCPGLIHYLRGFNLEYLHNTDYALSSYSNAINQSNFPWEVYLRQGIVFFELVKYQEAIQSLSLFLTKNDSTKYGYRARANAYVQISKYDSAILDYNRFLNIDSAHSDMYIARAFCYKTLGDYNNAIKDYYHVLKHNPFDIETVGLISVCKYLNGDTIGAYNLLNQTYMVTHDLSETGFYLLGTINLLKKQYQTSIENFNNVLLINPKNIDAMIYRGLAFYSIEEYKKAKTDFTAAIKINKDEITALYTLGLVNIKLKKSDEAFEDLSKAELLGHPLAKKVINTYLKTYNH